MSKISKNIMDALVEDLVHVNRVTKVVKGGRNFSFSAIVVVGDKNGRVGYGSGKAKEVTEARSKAAKEARNNMVSIVLYKGRTIYHDVIGTSGAAKIMLRRAPAGTGVIAGGALRSIFNCLGIKDIVVKSLGASNPNTMISATINALLKLNSPQVVASRRGRDIGTLFVNYNSKKL
jgi:small subunit ribosomal protein S5